jgi:hypothetical protein
MNSAMDLKYCNTPPDEVFPNAAVPLKFTYANERKVLKVILIGYLHQVFCELFKHKLQLNNKNSSLECYVMDSKILQLIIKGIIETGEYTLQGIAYHTHIPEDILYDAASGISNQFSVTPWARLVDLYLQVKPDTAQVLINRLLDLKNKNAAAISLLLTEE